MQSSTYNVDPHPDSHSPVPTPQSHPDHLPHSSQLTVLQPSGRLDQTTHSTFQATVEQALSRESQILVIDLIGVTAITPEGIAVLQAAMELADSLGKELIIWSADATTYEALSGQRDRQSAKQLGDRVETIDPGFSHFLKHRQHSNILDISSQPTVYPTPRSTSVAPILASDLYTPTHWHSSATISQIA